MSDDVRIKITGDNKSLKKKTTESEKLLKRMDAANKRATQRRIKQEQKAALLSRRITQQEVNKTMAIRKRAARLVERDRRQRERLAIQSARREARAKERIIKRSAQRQRRIMRGVSRFGLGAAGILGVGGIGGAVFAAREMLKFDVALARIAGSQDITIKKQFELREAMNRTSLATGVQRDVLLEAFEEIVDKSGKIDLAADNFDVISKILRGTKAEAQDVGKLFASISNSFKGTGRNLKNSDIAQFVEILVAQGDKAQINVANLASQGEKLFGAFKGAGFGTKRDFVNFGALIQTAGETGTPEEAATSAVRVLSTLIRKSKDLKKIGVNVFDKKGEQRNLDVILKQLFIKTGQKKPEDVSKLFDIFGLRAVKTIQVLAAEFRNNNQEFSEFTRLIEEGNNAAGNIERKFQRVAKTASQGFERMAAGLTIFADKALVGILNEMADAFNRLIDNPEAMKELGQTARHLGTLLKLGTKGVSFLAEAAVKSGTSQALESGPLFEAERIDRARTKKRTFGIQKFLLKKVFGAGGGEATAQAGNVALNVAVQTTVDPAGKPETTVDIDTQQNSDRGKSNAR